MRGAARAARRKVTDMREMFDGASAFNQPIGDYDAGDKGLKGCDFIASEPAKVDKRCSRRVGEDGVPALEACKQTCGKC